MTVPEDTPTTVATGVSAVAPSGGAGQGLDAEQQAGTAAAELNAANQEDALEARKKAALDTRDILSQRAAIGNKTDADAAEKIKGMVEELPPPGPGLPQVMPHVIAATMDPNNPVLNPDVSELGRNRGLPPGAYVPEPVLPQDTIQTQYASKPPTEAHGEEGLEVAKGMPEPLYPPAGSQPQIEMTEEEQEAADAASAEPSGQAAIPPPATPATEPAGEQPGQTP